MKDSFVIYTENEDIVNELSDEQAGKLFKALFCYQSGENVDIDDLATKIAFKTIKRQIDKCNEKYEKTREKRSEAGKKAMESRWGDNKSITNDNTAITNDSNVISEDNKNNLYVPVPVNVKEKEKSIEKKKRFTPPTLEDVQEYIEQKGYKVDASKFIDFYTSKGWLVGKTPMKDWRAAVRVWHGRDKPKENNRFNNFTGRNYDYAELERKLIQEQGL